MRVIVGLGNPDLRYDRTRHNVGYMVVDRLAHRHAPRAPVRARFHAGTVEASLREQRCLLVRPTTYMNRSGISVVEALAFYKADPGADLVVVTDDVALDPGRIRVRARGGSGGHNGLADIERALGTQDYPRVRVGIGASPAYMDQADYVLGRFTQEQWEAIEPALERAADAVECIIAQGVAQAMNRFNERQPGRPAGDVDPGWLDDTQGETA